MTRCDFCTKSSSDGKCYCDYQFIREDNYKKAIDRMVKSMGNNNKDTKRGKPFRWYIQVISQN